VPNDIDVQDHGSIFNHDAVVRFARSGGASALIAPLPQSPDAASSRLLGRILAAVSRLDEFPSPEPGLREISSLLDGIPGVSGAAFEIAPFIDFFGDHFDDAAEDPSDADTNAGAADERTADERTADERTIGSLRVIAGSGASADERNPMIPLRAGRTLYGWLRLHHETGAPPRRLAAELEAVGRLVALHLEKRQTIALLERANSDMAEAHLTLECDLRCMTVENAVLAAIAQSQGRALRGMAPDLALAPLFDALKDLTRARHVGIASDESEITGDDPIFPNRIVFDQPGTKLPDGPLAVAEAAVRDILSAASERTELCQAKCRAERAEFADLAKTEFLATMSHELRTPLNAILGFAELLKNQSFGPLGSARYVGYAADIHDSGKLLLQIISDIMDVAKVETGRINLAHDWVDAGHLMASVTRLIEPRAVAAGLSFEVALPERSLPRLWADERLIKQALLNVLSNAVKFTPSGGGIRMTAMVEPFSERLVIEITDTGLGIAKSELARVFEPFHRGDGAMNRRFEGTGLGLPLARSFVELHDGSLTLDSVQGTGTTVWISLPPAHQRD
jgi:signal transduction histidine kinase